MFVDRRLYVERLNKEVPDDVWFDNLSRMMKGLPLQLDYPLIERKFMAYAVAEAMKSPTKLKVGAVIAKGNCVISTGYRTPIEDAGPRTMHAEHIAISKAREAGHSLEGATMYVTLEPCVMRNNDGYTTQFEPCVDQIVKSGIGRVVIGSFDNNPKITLLGVTLLQDSGVFVSPMFSGLEHQLYALLGGRKYAGQPEFMQKLR